MNVDLFVDTNILVYAHDRNAGAKHETARGLVKAFWGQRQVPCVSIQVLQELHVNLTRRKIPTQESARTVARYLSWRVIENTRSLLQQAFQVQQRWKLSFWDALIVAAAQRANASRLWSEDLNEGQDYGGVVVENPLR